MPHRNHILVVLLLCAVTVVAYLPAFHAGYNFDDRPLLQNNPAVKSLKSTPQFFLSTDARVSWTQGDLGRDTYRPLQSLSFAVSYSVWGDNAAAFHRENVLLHVISGVLLYFLVIALLDSARVAFLAALVFLIHPVQVEAVTYLSERASLLSMMFFLISTHAFLRSQRAPGPYNRFTVAGIVAFSLSLLSKEAAIIFPAVMVLYCICFSGPARATARAVIGKTWPYFMVALAYVALRTANLGQVGQLQAIPLWQRLLVMTEAFGRYLYLTLFPGRLSFFPEMNTRPFELAPRYALYLAGVMVFVALTVLLFRKNRRMAFFPVAYLVALLPVSNIVPIKTFMQERFLYFPNAFMFPFMACYAIQGIEWLGRRYGSIARGGAVAAAGLAVIALTARSHARNRDWQSHESLMRSEAKAHPEDGRAYFDLAVERFARRDYDTARMYAEQALEHTRENARLAPIYNLLGKLDDLAGGEAAAIEHFRNAVRHDPGYPFPYNSMGLIHARHGRIKDAILFFEKAVELNASNPAFCNNLGRAYALDGDRERAVTAWNRSLALDPDQPDVREMIRESGGR